MKTALQELIQWTIENAFNVEAQDGTTYIAIDHEEMRTKFDEWLEEEREQITNAVKYGFKDATSVNPDVSFDLYYDETFNDDV